MSVESIYWYWIYPTKNWGNCVIWRISVHLLGAGLGKVHSVIYIFVLDICCQHLGYMRQLEGFYAPFGHKVRECTFCNIYIFVLDICYQQLGEMCQLEGFCAFFGCRPCTALQGEGTYIL